MNQKKASNMVKPLVVGCGEALSVEAIRRDTIGNGLSLHSHTVNEEPIADNDRLSIELDDELISADNQCSVARGDNIRLALGGLMAMADSYGLNEVVTSNDLVSLHQNNAIKPKYSKPKEVQSEKDKQLTLSKAEAKRERKRLKKKAQLLKTRGCMGFKKSYKERMSIVGSILATTCDPKTAIEIEFGVDTKEAEDMINSWYEDYDYKNRL